MCLFFAFRLIAGNKPLRFKWQIVIHKVLWFWARRRARSWAHCRTSAAASLVALVGLCRGPALDRSSRSRGARASSCRARTCRRRPGCCGSAWSGDRCCSCPSSWRTGWTLGGNASSPIGRTRTSRRSRRGPRADTGADRPALRGTA